MSWQKFIPIVKHSLNYNPYLDGLRGVAILLVVLFHVWPDYFSFGYVGVDIFFVISGFLITQIIFTKLEKNSFSFKEFYRNRIRRLFPALIILLITALFCIQASTSISNLQGILNFQHYTVKISN
jgi:peptidoglycan/LPS O-acetylase OafA/YrhL